jgi:hypothetical protein
MPINLFVFLLLYSEAWRIESWGSQSPFVCCSKWEKAGRISIPNGTAQKNSFPDDDGLKRFVWNGFFPLSSAAFHFVGINLMLTQNT